MSGQGREVVERPGAAMPPPSIDAAVVRRLIAAQFPQWADLRVAPVGLSGVDNRTFRLGDALTVRLPSAAGYVPQVEKEHRWLPVLAPHLPLPIPSPVARGVPGEGYPFSWSIYRWLDGDDASTGRIADLTELAESLAGFLAALQRIDATGGPPPGLHSFFRGGPLTTYDTATRRAIAALDGQIAGDAVTALWQEALATTWDGPPVWFHGDVSAGNLLVEDGRLAAVIDFGCSGVGDPACDLTIAWTFLSEESREAFRTALPLDSATWTRARGWALWKALITLAEQRDPHSPAAVAVRRTLAHVLQDHEQFG